MNNRTVGPCPDRRMLEAYLADQLSGRERHRVERHALDCPLCSAALEGMSQVPTSPTETERDLAAIRGALGDRLGPAPRRAIVRSSFRRRLLAAAATVAGLLLISWLVWYYTVGQRPYRLYLAAFDRQPVQAYRAMRAVQPATDLDPRIVQALSYLRNEDEPASLTAFRAYLNDDPSPEDGRPLLYAGLLALSTGYLPEARAYLEQSRRDYPELREDADWYLALSYLRANDPQRARPLLQQLADAPDGPGAYRREARELLEEL